MLQTITLKIIFIFLALCILQSNSYSQKSTVQEQDKAQPNPKAEPEKETGKSKKKLVRAQKYMIVAANPYASKAGDEILSKGGNAIDAMIAAQLVLNLVEPQSSGIGGGAFLLYWDNAKKKLHTYDGREAAPLSVKANHFIDKDGNTLGFQEAIQQGLAIGVPGVVKLLETTHKKYGKLSWQKIFQPAINLSQKGFKVSERLNKLLKATGAKKFGPDAQSYFFNQNGEAWPVGHVLKNPTFAKTLSLISLKGSQAFYSGELSKQIIDKVNIVSDGKNGMSLQDLSGYKIKKRDPVCIKYRSHKICGMGLPSSGGLTVSQVLKLIEPYDLKAGIEDHQTLHYIVEAQKLAYADRGRYMADPDFVPPPKGLLDKNYLKKRRKKINKTQAMKKALSGTPKFVKQGFYGNDKTIESSGTSHISIVDQEGNAVSYTTTIETAFGSKVMIGGFLLNNELTDFSFTPIDIQGRPVANRIEPGKRPRSSMAPTIVFDKKGNVELVLGSPGGSRIILYVLKTLIAMIDWNMDQQQAVELTNFGSRNGPFEMEKPGLGLTKLFLQSYGHKIKLSSMTSGLHVILKTKQGMYSGVDPRREGEALGK